VSPSTTRVTFLSMQRAYPEPIDSLHGDDVGGGGGGSGVSVEGEDELGRRVATIPAIATTATTAKTRSTTRRRDAIWMMMDPGAT